MGMKLVKRIREHLALNPYKMAQSLGKSIQGYQKLERVNERISLSDLYLLYTLSGLTPDVFMRWIAADVEKKKKKKVSV
jgi:transcriptional regulator with XRE-family HTH domain